MARTLGAGWLIALLAVVLVACSGDDDDGETAGPTDIIGGGGEITVASDAFAENDGVPLEHTCEGDDVSPPLSWSGVPEEAGSLVVIVDDPDAGGFVHWLVYDIPPEVEDLPIEAPDRAIFDSLGNQAENDFGDVGYSGPCPPEGEEHTYRFRVLAIDRRQEIEAGLPAAEVIAATEGHVIAEGALSAKFAR